jgi:anti-sigma B factor antagonist
MTAFIFVTTESQVLVGIFDGFSWIRCEGKGSFHNSPSLRSFGQTRIAHGEKCLVIDLDGCTGMDSTFMGTLAGLSSRMSTQNQGVVQVANASERSFHSLQDLGLDFLLEINPENPHWEGKSEQILGQLGILQPTPTQNLVQKTRHVLEAHQELSEINDKNQQTFTTVVNLLGSELEEKQIQKENSQQGPPHEK